MLKIGVQSKGILGSNLHELDDGICKIKMAGFDCIDLNLDIFLENIDLYRGKTTPFFDKSEKELKCYFRKYLVGIEKHSLVYSQMHAPYPVWVCQKDGQNAYMKWEVIPKCLMIAGYLNIPYVVIHPFKMQYIQNRREEQRQNIEFFKSLIPCAKENNVIICLENLYESIGGRLVEGVCADPEEAAWYIDSLNEEAREERFGFCLDTGHLNLVKRQPLDTIRKLGHRLKILHLHENDGIDDLHQLPYTFSLENGKGFDWDSMLQGLREIHYEGVLNFETFPCMNSFPDGVRFQVLETICSIGRYFASQMESN